MYTNNVPVSHSRPLYELSTLPLLNHLIFEIYRNSLLYYIVLQSFPSLMFPPHENTHVPAHLQETYKIYMVL